MFSLEKDVIKKTTRNLKKVLGNNLIAVAAFGSRVRGDFSEESDMDILVIVKKRTFDIMDTINQFFTEEETRTGIPFSVVIKGIETFEKEKSHNTSFYRNIRNEGVFFHGSA